MLASSLKSLLWEPIGAVLAVPDDSSFHLNAAVWDGVLEKGLLARRSVGCEDLVPTMAALYRVAFLIEVGQRFWGHAAATLVARGVVGPGCLNRE